MLLVRGHGGGTALTGTIFERGEQAPTYRGAPDEDAPYVWVCDEFYEVESGGSETEIDGRTIRVAFDTPLPRGFDTREQALSAAKEHVKTQFARVGVPADDVRVEVVRPEEEGTPEDEQPDAAGRSADEGSPEGDTSL
ncbi:MULTISPECIES: hypothetical protein [unclassified Haloferax]|uniref:DUF7113 family protein n=1 Tax=unclassified Haloferax TaxID=2625095 RepID=UPI0002B22643|nr:MULTISPECIES: hypothetical protein [unclassified Haloferax]ELZ55868.1 hypothetical protein C460_15400 [Haloferax sp. ATCC BAA-646]ELZ67388.1 hypothetical protein C459_02805 [Haloferax sp. ATCC BAA-645]ELZ67827.1 hypothetical protein C458_10715 [Haloferax sp. ATCC BAA-644]